MSDPAAGPGADQLWRRLAEAGSLRQLYREKDPSRGVDPAALRTLFARLDATESVGATLGVCVQATTSLPLLATTVRRTSGSSQPFATVVADVLKGEGMLGLAATDDTPGSDLATLRTTLTIDADHYRLSGRKEWVTNALYATHLLVLARHREGPGFTNFTWVIVPTDRPGVTVEAAAATLFAGSGSGHVSFDQVVLPHDHLGGPLGRGLIDFARHISVERLASGVWGQAMCQRVLRETVEYLRRRGTPEASLWDKEEIRRRIGRSLVATAQLDALIERFESRIADHHDHLAAALVKASAAETVDEVLSTAAHLQGARAFADGGLQTLRAQAALWSIGGGTYEVMLSNIADRADLLLDPAS